VAAKRVGLGRAVHAWLAVVDSMEARLAGGAGPAGSEPAAAIPAVSGARRPAAPYPLGWLPSQLAALRGAAPDSPDAVWEVGWASTATLVAISFELWSHWDDWRMTRDAALLAGHRVGDRLAPGPRPGEYRVVPGRLHPWSEVVTELEAGEATFAELGEWRWQAATAVSLGNLYRAQGRYALATATLRRGLDLFRDLDHPGWEAAALFSLGSLHVVDGCLTEAVARYEDCMAIFRRLGDPLWQAHTQRALGYAYQQHGQNAPAAAVLGRCHPVLRERDDPMWHGHTLLFLARAELGLGRYGDARAHLHACLADFRRRGDVRSEAMALRVLAAVTGRRAPAEAIVLLDDCLQLFRRFADPVGVAYTLGDLAEQHRAVGRLDRSASLDRSSRALLHDLGLRIPAEL
jgi:tetratricopeptide (TPR) repeat protein